MHQRRSGAEACLPVSDAAAGAGHNRHKRKVVIGFHVSFHYQVAVAGRQQPVCVAVAPVQRAAHLAGSIVRSQRPLTSI